MPPFSLQDSPLARVAAYDLTGAAGLALLRRFDAQWHRLPPEERPEALDGLRMALPLAERAEGLLVLPGGALAWREGQRVLLCDPASAIGLSPAPAGLRATAQADGWTIAHAGDGLRLLDGRVLSPQAATLLPRAGALAPLLPALAEWRGPAMIHWQAGGAAIWEMVPAPPALALAVSLVGEVLQPGEGLPAAFWAMQGGDEVYQHLASGLAAHLDELLASEVSDALRFALVARWTDGGESVSSRLADGLAMLPSSFGPDAMSPPGLAPLAGWPQAARLRAGQMLFGLSAAEAGGRWSAALRRACLSALRENVSAEASLLTGPALTEPVLLHSLAADRLVRATAQTMAALAPLDAAETPQRLLHRAATLSLALGVPLLLAVPGWGLCHWLDPDGGPGAGNAPAYGMGAFLEAFED
ncbi:hypothetical protein [Roseomonas marmotae]|uniref:Uncharacterized protein n=1 Tax=Roseomonas marmotae TaxID=2768161 RepID=A0ABS3KF74_9PROT|nr:hypothetical protein [Roseomonas marmotae]MBO1076121.1 hypothetical protein [Roseomonas marmotae]QTI81255.1 hypothetical protein IAI58_18020 [Roseomonas marmotae]